MIRDSEGWQTYGVTRQVKAHAAGWLYRARKLARRHRLGLAVALLVVGFAITSTVLWPIVDVKLVVDLQGTGARHTKVSAVESSLALVLHAQGRLAEARGG